ncbi:MAG: uroporphyrinogen decarboxylase family protein [Victivallaceae bacterium]|jgi:uroporphyrinogen decarboxylase
MKSKERVLTTLARCEPDRVPINYSANPGIDLRLKNHFGLKCDDSEGLRRRLCVDFLAAGTSYCGPKLHPDIPERRVDSCWGFVAKYTEHVNGGFWDYCDFPLADADLETVENWAMPSPDDFDYSLIYQHCKKHQECAMYVGNPGLACIINTAGFLLGMEQVLVGLAIDDPATLRLIDRMLAIQLEVTRRELEAAKGGVDFMWLGEDLGTQKGPLISMEMFRKHIKPRQKLFFDLAKSCNIPVMIHTCGSSSWAYDEYIEMGLTAVDTLQPEAKNMEPEYLKKTFGNRLAFHGCISTAGPVATGTVKDTIDYCRRTLEIMMPGGGYCFAPTHALQDNSPTENVVAMYETAKKYGKY